MFEIKIQRKLYFFYLGDVTTKEFGNESETKRGIFTQLPKKLYTTNYLYFVHVTFIRKEYLRRCIYFER